MSNRTGFFLTLCLALVLGVAAARAANTPWSTQNNSATDIVTVTNSTKFGTSVGAAQWRSATGAEVQAYIGGAVSGDCTATSSMVLTCTKLNGSAPGTAFTANTGTSGSTLGLLNGTLTFSGNDTFSGVPLFTGLSPGTQVSCLGLDSGNHLVLNASACGAGGASVSVTAATPDIVVTPSPGTGTFTVGTTQPINPQVGTSYTVLTGDNTSLIQFTNASAIAVTLPQAGSAGFSSGWSACFVDLGAGTATLTTTTSTINNSGQTLTLTTGMGACLTSDGTNWSGLVTLPKPNGSSVNFYRGDGTLATPAGSGGTVSVVGAGSLASGAMVTGGGTQLVQTDASITASAGALSLGSSGVAGSATFGNATSGQIVLQPVTGALGSVTLSLPAATDTLVGKSTTDTLSNKTLVAPALGTPASGVLTNATGLPAASVVAGALVNGMTATTQAQKDNSTSLATTAYVDRPVQLVVGSGAQTFSAPSKYVVCTTTCTVTPPVPSAGVQFCVQNNVAVSTVITIAAVSTVLYGKTDQSAYGTATTGTMVSAGAVGDKVCLLGVDATHYNVGSFNGTWTNS